MGIEIEAKMRLDDTEAMEARLLALDAKRCGDLVEINTYFDRPDGSLQASDQGLRLRVETPLDRRVPSVVRLTYKGPNTDSQLKRRTEIELTLDSADAALDLLRAIGFEPGRRFEKHRRRWQMGRCWVDIDTVPYLGDFIEIEGPDDQAVFAVRRQLGLEGAPLVPDSYIGLLEAYLVENRITADRIPLDRSP